jgi:hypothetical protein
VKERLAVSKRAAQKIDTDRFNLKKLNEGDVKEQHQGRIRNQSAAPENLKDSGDINGHGTILDRMSSFWAKVV